jgi:hypothetical protein
LGFLRKWLNVGTVPIDYKGFQKREGWGRGTKRGAVGMGRGTFPLLFAFQLSYTRKKTQDDFF